MFCEKDQTTIIDCRDQNPSETTINVVVVKAADKICHLDFMVDFLCYAYVALLNDLQLQLAKKLGQSPS
jgi:hypothetical protein